jgi:hypothetical protein
MSSSDSSAISRDDLIAMVNRAHNDAAYKDASEAGRALAAQSKLPKLVAENLGAGFGQWDFFPEIPEIVDFALGYQPPADEAGLMELAKTWASDEAASKHTMMNLVGREILQHELRRIDHPQLRELVNETRAPRERVLRQTLGLAVREMKEDAPAKPKREPRAQKAAPTEKREIPLKMPKPEFKKPIPAAPPPPPKRFQHPKFGEGVLQSQEGTGDDRKLTIKFAAGPKTLLARYVTELPD